MQSLYNTPGSNTDLEHSHVVAPNFFTVKLNKGIIGHFRTMSKCKIVLL